MLDPLPAEAEPQPRFLDELPTKRNLLLSQPDQNPNVETSMNQLQHEKVPKSCDFIYPTLHTHSLRFIFHVEHAIHKSWLK